jgi:hypothetical protein
MQAGGNKYEDKLKHLVSIQSQLLSSLKVAESRLKAFQNVTSDCLQYIQKYQKKYCQRYLKIWFRSYLAMKDECMILINGEIIRQYHIPIHESYIHKRGNEAHWYNKKCTLSACSVDGIDYEYRNLIESYGSKSVRRTIFFLLRDFNYFLSRY